MLFVDELMENQLGFWGGGKLFCLFFQLHNENRKSVSAWLFIYRKQKK